MRSGSVLNVAAAAAAFGLASLPLSASAGCGCRSHETYATYSYATPAVVYHRNQYPMAYYNEPAPPYYSRRAYYRHHHRGPAGHPPLSRYY